MLGQSVCEADILLSYRGNEMRDVSYDYYRELFRTCISDEWNSALNTELTILRGQSKYEAVEEQTGVPWLVVGILHLMESDCDFTKQILNGQVWNRRTTLVPKRLGPWDSWEESAIFALREWRKYNNWSVPNILKRLESWNGWGYKYRDKHSPYLWGKSNHGVSTGKFTSDGKYSSSAKTKQLGAAVVLKDMITSGVWAPPPFKLELPIVFDRYGEFIRAEVISLQLHLNTVTKSDKLLADGWAGTKTSTLFAAMYGNYLIGDNRGEA
jgi:lysozyme family protein